MSELTGAALERLVDEIIAARKSKFRRTVRSVMKKLRELEVYDRIMSKHIKVGSCGTIKSG